MNLFYDLVMNPSGSHTFEAKKICHETIKDLCIRDAYVVCDLSGFLCSSSSG